MSRREPHPAAPSPLDISVTELELVAARGWQGTSTDQLGQWLLRAGGGFTGRANSALVVGEPGMSLEEALNRVHRFYAEHDLPPLLQLPFASDAGHPLSDELIARGWQLYDHIAVLVADLPVRPVSVTVRRGGGRENPTAATFSDSPDEDWLAGYHYRGRPLPANAITVLRNAERPVFASLRANGQIQAVARGVVTDGWLGITAVTVTPMFRRMGLGSHLMSELLDWGRRGGAVGAYLQVDGQNAAALAMYDRLGFHVHHHYSYATFPASNDGNPRQTTGE